jgi:hypothetical protein
MAAFDRHWKLLPPMQKLVAGYVGYEPPISQDIAELGGVGTAKALKPHEFADVLKTHGLPP